MIYLRLLKVKFISIYFPPVVLFVIIICQCSSLKQKEFTMISRCGPDEPAGEHQDEQDPATSSEEQPVVPHGLCLTFPSFPKESRRI